MEVKDIRAATNWPLVKGERSRLAIEEGDGAATGGARIDLE